MLSVTICRETQCKRLGKAEGFGWYICNVSKKQPRYMKKCPREDELSYVNDALGVVQG
ncbi:hypothetical protein [Methanosarcina siciliae]|uniref:hypothetical protein n=1 Tax=Methanosarcina siciliae TaxID=38027 RepID=UPI000B15BDFF|nr:hypothetical protein [Methanosarcina siciliae]